MSSKVCLAWLLLASASLPSACAPRGPSTVAQGKYYSSTNPRYAEFFIGLFDRQLEMETATKLPAAEHRVLTEAVQLPSTATPAELERKLREKALELSRAGIRMRLERGPDGKVDLRATSRPKSAFVDTVEKAATELAGLARGLKSNDLELNRLERRTVELDANVDVAFSGGERTEVKKNLADAHKLLALMRVRSTDLAATTNEQLEMLRRALSTDDGSLATPPPAPEVPPTVTPSEPKKPGKPRAVSAPRPKPAAPAKPVEAAPKPSAPAKPAPAPRDFEP